MTGPVAVKGDLGDSGLAIFHPDRFGDAFITLNPAQQTPFEKRDLQSFNLENANDFISPLIIPDIPNGKTDFDIAGFTTETGALATAKSIAVHTRQRLDYNRQCIAEGLGNLIGGFFQSLPGSGSLTRSAINYQAGAITRMSGIYTSLIVGVVVLVLGPYARFIPKPALAGLLFIAAARLIDWKRLSYAIRASRFDGTLVFVTALSAILISIEDSILIGVAISLILFVPRVSKLGIRELIVTPERVVRERKPNEARSNSLLIYDLEGELFFGAAPELDHYLEQIKQEATSTGIKLAVIVFSTHAFNENHFNFDFWEKVDGILTPTVNLRMAFLPAEAFDLGDGRSLDTEIRQRLSDFRQFERFCNRSSFLSFIALLARLLEEVCLFEQ
jgi:MFS superfamily sulfate permease-like transporter